MTEQTQEEENRQNNKRTQGLENSDHMLLENHEVVSLDKSLNLLLK